MHLKYWSGHCRSLSGVRKDAALERDVVMPVLHGRSFRYYISFLYKARTP